MYKVAISGKDIWKLIKWAKKHSHFLFKLSVISPLHIKIEKVTQTIIMLEVKAKMLWDWFFLSKLKADLGDIKRYNYLFEVKAVS